MKINRTFFAIVIASIIVMAAGTYAVLEVLPSSLPTPVGAPPDDLFHHPLAVTTDSSSNLYIADTVNSRIQVFDSAGTFVKSIGFPGTNNDDESLNNPAGVAINSAGQLVVSDTNNSILKFFDLTKATPNLIHSIGIPGTGTPSSGQPPELYRPAGLTTRDSDTNLLLADSFNNRILVLSKDGTFLSAIQHTFP